MFCQMTKQTRRVVKRRRYNNAKLDIVDWYRNGVGGVYPVCEAVVPSSFVVTDDDAEKGIPESVTLCMLARAICRAFGWQPDDGDMLAVKYGFQINETAAHVPVPDKKHGVIIYRYTLPSWIKKWDGSKKLVGHLITMRPPSYSMQLLTRRADSAARRAEAATNGNGNKRNGKKKQTRAAPAWSMRGHKGWRASGHA